MKKAQVTVGNPMSLQQFNDRYNGNYGQRTGATGNSGGSGAGNYARDVNGEYTIGGTKGNVIGSYTNMAAGDRRPMGSK